MLLQCQNGHLTIAGVAVVIAEAETRCDFSQIVRSDRLTAQCAEGLRAGRSAIHQDEIHVPPPNEKQNTVSAGLLVEDGDVLDRGSDLTPLPPPYPDDQNLIKVKSALFDPDGFDLLTANERRA